MPKKMFDYLNDVGGEIILGEIAKPPHQFESATDIFEKALEHEKKVTKSIFNIVKMQMTKVILQQLHSCNGSSMSK